MNDHALSGDIGQAFSHFALTGVASILVDAGHQATTRWSDEITPRPILSTACSAEQIGATVHAHASAHYDERSWVRAVSTVGASKGAGMFSPRVTAHSKADLPLHVAQRRAALHRAKAAGLMTDLDWKMLNGLGEPAWWRYPRSGDPKPDVGASRWEMKSRAGVGQDFVGSRLAALAGHLQARTPQTVWSGLAGKSLKDDLDSKWSSQTSTGLRWPGPVDSALAWCALWSIALMPTSHVASTPQSGIGVSVTPGAYPHHAQVPKIMALPVYTEPVTAARFRSIMRTAEFDTAAFGNTGDPAVAVARTWLARQGVRAIIRFPVKPGAGLMPSTRELQAGTLDPL